MSLRLAGLVSSLSQCFYAEHWEEVLEAIEHEGGLSMPEVIGALSAYADVEAVHRRLARSPPAALAPWLENTSVRPSSRLVLRALFQQAVLAAPDSLATLSGDAKALAERTLVNAGHGLPRTGWASPWKSAATKSKPAKAEAPALPSLPERFHFDRPLEPRTNTERDGELERLWEQQAIGGRRMLALLHEASDGLFARLWRSLVPSGVWVYADDLARLVPRAGVPGLDLSLQLVSEYPDQLEALATLESMRAAPLMADGFSGRPALQQVARAWFDRFPEVATVGLVGAAMSRDKTSAQRAQAALTHVRRTQPDAFVRGLAHFDDAVGSALANLLERGVELPARQPALPEFATPARLPRVRLPSGAVLDDEAMIDLLTLLKVTPLGGAAWLDDLRATFTTASLTRLARTLLEEWLVHGAPPKEKWALQSLAHFGDDEVARELATMAADLAPRGLSARAQEMLEVLGAMQTRTSLKLVHDLGRKVRSKAFRARAALVFTTAAEKQGLTEDELAERLVPEFGLSPEGVLRADGAFVVRLELDGVKPRFTDEAGRVLKKLPELADEELAAELAALKKRAPALLRELSDRLERRMSAARRMSAEHFTEVYLMNGLARRLAERLVWGLYDGGRLETTFHPAPTGCVDAQGVAVTLTEGRSVGVVHPLELLPLARQQWMARLPAQPFEQLRRRIAELAGVDALSAATRGYVGRTVPTGAILKLEHAGWERGPTEQGGCYLTASRRLASGVVELMFTPGIYLGDLTMHRQQQLEHLALRLSASASAIDLSEVAHDLVTAFGPPE